MARLINADALLKAIINYPYGYRGMIESEIENQPTMDAEPVRHGKWINREYGMKRDGKTYPFWERYECSICGERADQTAYCPNCGARMDEE